jgi:hypothetical protein
MICTGACLCLKTEESYLSCASQMLVPKDSAWPFLLDAIDNPNAE